MRSKGAAVLIALVLLALTGSLLLGSRRPPEQVTACGAVTATTTTATASKAVAGYSGTQLDNAAAIINAGAAAGIDQHGQTLAVMVAAGETGLRALTYGDAAGPDSRGLFQQRASWGSLADRLDPTRSATLFYRRLATITGWQQMTPTAAAHAVQGNADPNYYTRFWAPAKAIVAALASTSTTTDTCTSSVGGDPQALAAHLVEAIDAGRITGLVPDHLREIRWIADGRTVANCGVDTRILQVITIALDTFNRLGISDINRRCTGQILGAGTESSHWIHGGGQAVDFYSLGGIAATGGDPNSLKLIRTLDPLSPNGARVGQQQCRPAIALTHLTAFPDTCNHLHVDVAYTTGPLDIPDAIPTIALQRSTRATSGAAGAGQIALVGSSPLRAIIRGSTPGRLLLPAGTFALDDFQNDLHGADLPAGGLQGAGSSRTIIAMTPHSSTRADDVPTRAYTTNQLDLLAVTGGSPQLGGFTLRATDQGHLYNGLLVGRASGVRASDITVVGVPGTAAYPPGETFAINDWHTTGSIWTNITIDGAGVSAAAFGANSSRDLTIRDSTFTGTAASHGIAIWQTQNVDLEHVTIVGNRSGINFERTSGDIVIRDSTFANNAKYDLQFGTDRMGSDVTIVNPLLAPGQRLRINCPSRYHGTVNGQQRPRIHVIVNGQDRTADLIAWI